MQRASALDLRTGKRRLLNADLMFPDFHENLIGENCLHKQLTKLLIVRGWM